jgi:hypothetical protein
MEHAVAHLTQDQQKTFARVIQSTHRCWESSRVDKKVTYDDLKALWGLYRKAARSEEPYVPARVAQYAKLTRLFELFHGGNAALLFALSHREGVCCLFPHRGRTHAVHFDAPTLQRRIRAVLWKQQILGTPVCIAWLYSVDHTA